MDFQTLVTRVANKLNRTSADALTRIGASINDHYREVLSGVGLQTSVRTTVSGSTVIGVRDFIFPCEKLFIVMDPSYTPPRVLDERTMDELENNQLGTQPPVTYAIKRMGASTVTIFLDCTPTTVFPLIAEAEISIVDLIGVQSPEFAASFHDLLYRAGMMDELEHMEKYDLAKVQERRFQTRLGELRYFVAKSAYLRIYQGKNSMNVAGIVGLQV